MTNPSRAQQRTTATTVTGIAWLVWATIRLIIVVLYLQYAAITGDDAQSRAAIAGLIDTALVGAIGVVILWRGRQWLWGALAYAIFSAVLSVTQALDSSDETLIYAAVMPMIVGVITLVAALQPRRA